MFRNFSTFPPGTIVHRVVADDDTIVYQGDDRERAARVADEIGFGLLNSYSTRGEDTPKWLSSEHFGY